MRRPAGQLRDVGVLFVGPLSFASADFLAGIDEEIPTIGDRSWAQFRVSVIGMRESDELETFIRDTAAVHWSTIHPPMGEEELLVILRDHAAFLRNRRPPPLPERPAPPPFRGVLAMTNDDELSAFIRDNGIKFYRGPNLEAEREAEIFKAIRGAAQARASSGEEARIFAQRLRRRVRSKLI